jgi:hypothetical protein
MAKDFDHDGGLDIAAISYFPDFKNQPQEAFIYLENKGTNSTRQETFNLPHILLKNSTRANGLLWMQAILMAMATMILY